MLDSLTTKIARAREMLNGLIWFIFAFLYVISGIFFISGIVENDLQITRHEIDAVIFMIWARVEMINVERKKQ